MSHDVFISHATKDKTVANAICAALEGAEIRCWIAPRDVQPGRSFAGEINRAIQQSRAMVLVFSAHSNNSEQVLREVQLAVNAHLHIIQMRIEDVRMNDDLEYFLSTPHWLDAMNPPLENHLERLKTALQALLEASAKPMETANTAPISPSPHKLNRPANPSRDHMISPHDRAIRSAPGRRRRLLITGAIVGLVTAGVFGSWWLGFEQRRRVVEQQMKSSEPKEKGRKDRDASDEREKGEKEHLSGAQLTPREAAVETARGDETIELASKEQPYVNSLGMKFVPVPEGRIFSSVFGKRG